MAKKAYSKSGERSRVVYEKKKLGMLLMLGRSFNIHVGISQQRVDASYFSAGSRDQYNLVIALGNLSTEGKEMMFREYKEKMKSDRKQGTGYLTINATDFTPIQVPYISDMKLVNRYIKEAVNR